jgi:hypothetical protein
VPPIFKQSSQPFADGFTFRIWFRWVHSIAAPSLNPRFYLDILPLPVSLPLPGAGAGAFAFLVVIPEGDLLLMLSCLAPAVLVVIPEEPALSEIEWGICCYV